VRGRLAAEVGPAALVLLAAVVWLRLRGAPGFPVDHAALPDGSDWPQYLAAAHVMAGDHDPGLLAAWPDWRKALYPWLLGLGVRAGAPREAALVLGWVGVVALAAGTWLSARVLAGRVAAAVAVGFAVAPAMMGHAPGWMTPYPLLGGAVALALGLAAWGARSQDAAVALSVAAGAVAGVAWALDVRGALAAVGGGAVLAGSCAVAWRRAWSGRARARAVLPVVAFLLAVLPAPVVERSVALTRLPAPGESTREARQPLPLQLLAQARVGRDEIAARGPAAVRAACPVLEVGAPGAVPGWSELRAAADLRCARALVAHNLAALGDDGELPAVGWWILPALAVLLAPRRRGDGAGLRGVAAAVVGVPWLGALAGAAWTLFPDRYLLVVLGPLAAGVAAGGACIGARLGGAVGSRAALAVAVLGGLLGPEPRPRAVPSRNGAAARAWLSSRVTPGDAWMDCAMLGLGALDLPRRTHPAPYNLYGSDAHACAAWVSDPTGGRAGDRWVVTVEGGPQGPPGASWRVEEVFAVQAMPQELAVALWRWDPAR
jgi:MFS family permease